MTNPTPSLPDAMALLEMQGTIILVAKMTGT
jgi:hypothetical protein